MPSDLPRIVTRVPIETNEKFLKICEIEDRKASNLLGLIVKDYIKSYEDLHGELILQKDGTYQIKDNKSGKSSTLRSG